MGGYKKLIGKGLKFSIALILSLIVSLWLTTSYVEVYTVSDTIYVDGNNGLGLSSEETASFETFMKSLEILLCSSKEIEEQVVEKSILQLQHEHVVIPPLRLKFIPTISSLENRIRYLVKRLFPPVCEWQTVEQKRYLQKKKITSIVKKYLSIKVYKENVITISYTGPDLFICGHIVNNMTERCKELLLQWKKQSTQEALRAAEWKRRLMTEKLEEFEQQFIRLQLEQFPYSLEAQIELLQKRQHMEEWLQELQMELDIIRWKKHHITDNQEKARLEAEEAILTIKTNTFHKTIARYDTALKADPDIFRRSTSLERQIRIYEHLLSHVTQRYETLNGKFGREDSKNDQNLVRIISHSTEYPESQSFVVFGISWFISFVILIGVIPFSQHLKRYRGR